MANKLPETAVVYSEMVPTRDGEQLFTLVIKPAKEGKFPVVLGRCPYNGPFDEEVTKDNYIDLHFALNYEAGTGDNYDIFVQNGYALVYQHCRGMGNSTGYMVLGKHDCNDALDTMAWIRKQDFYNGEIFRYGQSYCGMSAIIDAGTHQEDVKGIAALTMAPAPDVYAVKAGLYQNGFAGYWDFSIPPAMGNKGPQKTNYNEDVYRTFPQRDIDKLVLGTEDEYLQAWRNHPSRNDPFWREESPMRELYKTLEELDTPTLFSTAWFDQHLEHVMDYWNALPETAREKSAMLITPYGHGFDFPQTDKWPIGMKDASIRQIFPRYAVNWFNHLRNGEELKLFKENTVTFFPEAGDSKWYREPSKLTDGENRHVVYLNADRTLGEEACEPSEITYLYNPYNPAVFYGWCGSSAGLPRPGSWAEEYGPGCALQPQDPPNWRYDVISFEMSPFTEAQTIKGGIRVSLNVKSDCEDTCFYARLCLKKDGVTYGIRDNIITLCDHLGDYTPGEEVTVEMDMPELVWEVKPGDQLRLDISSSCYYQYSPHTNVKGHQADVEKPKYAHNTVVLGKSNMVYYTADITDKKYEMIEVDGKIE